MHATDHQTTPLHAALLYATMGWTVVPLHTPTEHGCSCTRPACDSPGKHPRTRRGVYDATADLDAVERTWRRWPDANIGIATGRVIVLDIDGAEGLTGLAELEHHHKPLPATATARTGRGVHLYFLAATPIGNSDVGLPDGVHVRGRGGYAVAPPSLHAIGVRYRWKRGGPLAPLPAWFAELFATRSMPTRARSMPPIVTGARYLQRALEGEVELVATAPKGTRNTTLNRAAFRLGQLTAAQLGTEAELSQPLLAAARAAGLDAAEARTTIASGLRAGRLRPRAIRTEGSTRTRSPAGRGPTHPGGWHA
jgi:hypothetical protein